MKNFIEKIQMLLALIPSLISGLKQLEEAIPESGKGPEKLALMMNILEQAHWETKELQGDFNSHTSFLKSCIAILVRILFK